MLGHKKIPFKEFFLLKVETTPSTIHLLRLHCLTSYPRSFTYVVNQWRRLNSGGRELLQDTRYNFQLDRGATPTEIYFSYQTFSAFGLRCSSFPFGGRLCQLTLEADGGF